MKYMKLAAALLVLLIAVTTHATTIAGVPFPGTVTVGSQPLLLNGAGLRKKFWINVYAGALYLPQKAANTEAVLTQRGATRIVMHLLHDISQNQFADAWNHDFKSNNSDDVYSTIRQRLNRFNSFFADTEKSQQIVIDYVPATGTSVTIDGNSKGTIAREDFHTALMRVFVGDNPPTDALKRALLGNTKD